MGKKRKRVYEALVDGAVEGLSGEELYHYVLERCPKTSSKRIVHASLLALSDEHLRDKNILDVIYALAIKHRTDPVSLGQDLDADDDDGDFMVPSIKEREEELLD